MSCSYQAPQHWVIVKLDARGDYARIAANANGTLAVGGVPCGAATVLNTDDITVQDSSGASTKIELDGSQANFGPGVTDEGFGSEIEIHVDMMGGNSDSLILDGNKSGASIVTGTPGTNLNAGSEPFGEDSDLTVAGRGVHDRERLLRRGLDQRAGRRGNRAAVDAAPRAGRRRR